MALGLLDGRVVCGEPEGGRAGARGGPRAVGPPEAAVAAACWPTAVAERHGDLTATSGFLLEPDLKDGLAHVRALVRRLGGTI